MSPLIFIFFLPTSGNLFVKSVDPCALEAPLEEGSIHQGHCTPDPVQAALVYQRVDSYEANVSLGERHYVMGNYPLSIEYFQKAQNKANPTQGPMDITNATLEYWIALSHFSMGQRSEAEKVLKKLLKSRIKICETGFSCQSKEQLSRGPIILSLAQVLDYRRRWTEATELIEKYLKEKNLTSTRFLLDIRLLLGHFYFRLQKTKKAYLEFARILKFYPQSGQAIWLRDHYAANEILKKFGSQVSSI